jgi:hypothetical protein
MALAAFLLTFAVITLEASAKLDETTCGWRDWGTGEWRNLVPGEQAASYPTQNTQVLWGGGPARARTCRRDSRNHTQYRWIPTRSECSVPQFDVHHYNRCLGNMTIGFLGDSHYAQAGVSLALRCSHAQPRCSFQVKGQTTMPTLANGYFKDRVHHYLKVCLQTLDPSPSHATWPCLMTRPPSHNRKQQSMPTFWWSAQATILTNTGSAKVTRCA